MSVGQRLQDRVLRGVRARLAGPRPGNRSRPRSKRGSLNQAGSPALIDGCSERTSALAERLATLTLSLGVHEVGKAFGLGQVELAVLEGAAGEFAGLGRCRTPGTAERKPGSSPRRRLGPPWTCSSATSSPVKLAGSRKPERQSIVEREPAFRLAERACARRCAACGRSGDP